MINVIKDLQQIPGIGERMAADLRSIGIHSVQGLKNKDPEKLYLKLRAKIGRHIDRCVLYVFRCAVYYAEGGRNGEKLKWWNWKDKK